MQVRYVSNVVILTSDIKFGDIELLERRKPSALMLLDDDGDPKFAIGTGDGSIGEFGIEFSGADRSGRATVTVDIIPDSDDEEAIKQEIVEELGGVFKNLMVIEDNLRDGNAIAAIEEDDAYLRGLVEVL